MMCQTLVELTRPVCPRLETRNTMGASAGPAIGRDVPRRSSARREALVRDWLRRSELEGNHPRPHRELVVLLVVDRASGPDLRRGFVQGEGQDRRGPELLRVRTPDVVPPAGDQVLHERSHRVELLLRI